MHVTTRRVTRHDTTRRERELLRRIEVHTNIPERLVHAAGELREDVDEVVHLPAQLRASFTHLRVHTRADALERRLRRVLHRLVALTVNPLHDAHVAVVVTPEPSHRRVSRRPHRRQLLARRHTHRLKLSAVLIPHLGLLVRHDGPHRLLLRRNIVPHPQLTIRNSRTHRLLHLRQRVLRGGLLAENDGTHLLLLSGSNVTHGELLRGRVRQHPRLRRLSIRQHLRPPITDGQTHRLHRAQRDRRHVLHRRRRSHRVLIHDRRGRHVDVVAQVRDRETGQRGRRASHIGLAGQHALHQPLDRVRAQLRHHPRGRPDTQHTLECVLHALRELRDLRLNTLLLRLQAVHDTLGRVHTTVIETTSDDVSDTVGLLLVLVPRPDIRLLLTARSVQESVSESNALIDTSPGDLLQDSARNPSLHQLLQLVRELLHPTHIRRHTTRGTSNTRVGRPLAAGEVHVIAHVQVTPGQETTRDRLLDALKLRSLVLRVLQLLVQPFSLPIQALQVRLELPCAGRRHVTGRLRQVLVLAETEQAIHSRIPARQRAGYLVADRPPAHISAQIRAETSDTLTTSLLLLPATLLLPLLLLSLTLSVTLTLLSLAQSLTGTLDTLLRSLTLPVRLRRLRLPTVLDTLKVTLSPRQTILRGRHRTTSSKRRVLASHDRVTPPVHLRMPAHTANFLSSEHMLAIRQPCEDVVRRSRSGTVDRATSSLLPVRSALVRFVRAKPAIPQAANPLTHPHIAALVQLRERVAKIRDLAHRVLVAGHADSGRGIIRDVQQRLMDVLDLPLGLIRSRHANERHRLVVVKITQLFLRHPDVLFQGGDLGVDSGVRVHLLQFPQPLLSDPDLGMKFSVVGFEVDVRDTSDRGREVLCRSLAVVESVDRTRQFLVRGVRQLLDTERAFLPQRHEEVHKPLGSAPVEQGLEVPEPVLLGVDLLFHRVDPRPHRDLSVGRLLREVEEAVPGFDQVLRDLLKLLLRLDGLSGQGRDPARSSLSRNPSFFCSCGVGRHDFDQTLHRQVGVGLCDRLEDLSGLSRVACINHVRKGHVQFGHLAFHLSERAFVTDQASDRLIDLVHPSRVRNPIQRVAEVVDIVRAEEVISTRPLANTLDSGDHLIAATLNPFERLCVSVSTSDVFAREQRIRNLDARQRDAGNSGHLPDDSQRGAELAHIARHSTHQVVLSRQRLKRRLGFHNPRRQQKEPASRHRCHSGDTTDRADSNLHRAGDLLRHIPKLVQTICQSVQSAYRKPATGLAH